MDRRKFLKQVTLMTSGMTLAAGAGIIPNRLFAKSLSRGNLSLDIITNEPDEAILKVEGLLHDANLPMKNFKFREYPLPGTQVGDIVLIQDNMLIDFRNSYDQFSKSVFELSQQLELPKKLQNPFLLNFSTGETNLDSESVNIYQKGILTKQLKIADDIEYLKIEGSKGPVVFSIKQKQVKIETAACKHKTCMKMGSISKPGQNLVCIPNELRISIAGENEFGIDGLSF